MRRIMEASLIILVCVSVVGLCLLQRDFTYKKGGKEVIGSVLLSTQVKYHMNCGSLCFTLPNCFVFNVKKENGTKYCFLVEEIFDLVPNFNCDYYIDFIGYHQYHGFILYRESWIKMALFPMKYDDAVQYCKDKRAEVFHPSDQDDNDFIVARMKEKNLDYMWYPINDIEREGNYTWINGSVVTQTAAVPWSYEQYGYNSVLLTSEVSDCAQISNTGRVAIFWCGYNDAGVICKSVLQPN